MKLSEEFWGNLLKWLVFLFVTVGGGYEIFSGIRDKHIQSSLIFIFLSFTIFAGRIFYAIASGARKSLPAEIYGAIVMVLMFCLHLYYN